MRRHWIVTVAVLFAMVLATGWALAQDGERPERHEGRDRAKRGQREGGPRDRRSGDRMRRPDPLRGLDLTEDQKKNIAKLRKAAMEKIKAINEQLRKDIAAELTDEQKEKLKERHKRHGPPDLGLTDEQKARGAKIRKAAMAKMKDADPEDRRAIMEQMRKDLGKLLTEEQREKLAEIRKKMRDRRDRRPGGGDRRPPRGRPEPEDE